MRLQIGSEIVTHGSERKTFYLKLPKNFVELFGLVKGNVRIDACDEYKPGLVRVADLSDGVLKTRKKSFPRKIVVLRIE